MLFEVLFLVAIGWGLTQVYRRASGGGAPGPGRPHHPQFPPGPVERSVTEEVNHRGPAPGATQLPPKVLREQRMAELRRQYVNDEITVEEYEAALDKLMRPE